MLIRSSYLGAALARSLGQHSCVLMRGHGSTVVGTSLEQAVYRAIYAEVNAKLQLAAQGLGDITFLNTESNSTGSSLSSSNNGYRSGCSVKHVMAEGCTPSRRSDTSTLRPVFKKNLIIETRLSKDS